MKTKLKKRLLAPLLGLTLFTAVLPAAKGNIFEREVTKFCTVNVITSTGITQAYGSYTDCSPALRWWCTPQPCMAISTPEQ